MPVNDNGRMSNNELVAEFMNFSKHGAMSHLFVMHSLEESARNIISRPRPNPDDHKGEFVCPATWWDTAKEFIDKLEANRKL